MTRIWRVDPDPSYPLTGQFETLTGRALRSSATKTSSRGCAMPCKGSPGQSCGGMFQIGVFAVNCSGPAPAPPPPPQPRPFNNPALPLQARLDDLLPRLTKEDLLNQLGGPAIVASQSQIIANQNGTTSHIWIRDVFLLSDPSTQHVSHPAQRTLNPR